MIKNKNMGIWVLHWFEIGFIYDIKLNFTRICHATKIRYMPKKL